jgi:dihydroorotase-like cyclic amidohydrolase
LIKNGTMVTAADEYRADVLVDGGKIIAIGGGLDDRTHGFETTAAAIVGGTTTVVDFAPQAAGLGLGDSAIKHDEEQAKGKAATDYSLHGLAMDVSERLFDEIPQPADAGVPTASRSWCMPRTATSWICCRRTASGPANWNPAITRRRGRPRWRRKRPLAPCRRPLWPTRRYSWCT